jgi:AcrR family transcriptional regulator
MSVGGIDQPPRRRTGGRSARVREAALRAVLDTVAERGPDAVTMNEVARRAGVHATSVQRRWGTRQKLVLDALLAYSREQLTIPDTGALRGDLATLAQSLAEYLATPLGLMLAQAMAVADDDDEIAAARADFWNARYDATKIIISRAVQRGELPPGTDSELVIQMVIAPIHFRALLTRQAIDDGLIAHIVDAVERGFGTTLYQKANR